eukprot:Sdes_comp18723_c0_seq1m9056
MLLGIDNWVRIIILVLYHFPLSGPKFTYLLQTGLFRDDLYNENEPAVVEALSRLPRRVQDDRLYRIHRALDLSCKHDILPVEEWTKDQDDVRYLKPMLEKVREEFKEKEIWNNQ